MARELPHAHLVETTGAGDDRRRRTLRRDPYGLVETTTTVAGRPVRELASGRPRGRPEIVLLPGLGAPGYLAPWARQSATWTRATLLDLPGWRAGRARSCAPGLDAIAAATGSWLEATHRHGVLLIGHSTGAQSVLRTALHMPDRVAGVVLAGPTFAPEVRTRAALLRRAFGTIAHETPAELMAVGPSYLHSGGGPLLRFLLSALPDRPEDLVPRLTVPVLVVTGEHDGFAPPQWAHRLARLASAPCVVLPGAHNAPFPFPREADAAVQDFAATHWRSRKPSRSADELGVSGSG
jgi:pimeloyl-ACP methyl ester carboxylesterase